MQPHPGARTLLRAPVSAPSVSNRHHVASVHSATLMQQAPCPHGARTGIAATVRFWHIAATCWSCKDAQQASNPRSPFVTVAHSALGAPPARNLLGEAVYNPSRSSGSPVGSSTQRGHP